ncbi:MAG: phospho-sugar mutase [bacterium]
MEQKINFEKLREGIHTIPVSEDKKEKVYNNILLWLEDSRFEAYRPQIVDLIQKESYDLLVDSFYQMMPFGTGGRRGPIGIGTNRLNPYTLCASIQGHIDYLKHKYENESLSVVIAFDVRKFVDLRKIYNSQLPNPLLGLSSKDFAVLAVNVYSANGVKSYLLDPKGSSFMSTPELSFFIRRLKAYGGVNISASHNPPDDNGAKFYNREGAQPVPPEDQKISEFVDKISQIKMNTFDEARAQGLVEYISPAQREEYINLNCTISVLSEERDAIILYTPLHGTGSTTVEAVLRKAGFGVKIVEDQYSFDGSFKACPFRIPNPEVPQSFDMAINQVTEDIDLILSTDPDADRIGLMAPYKGTWQFIKGNEIAVITLHFLLATMKKQGRLNPNQIAIKTEVTTSLFSDIAASFNIRVVDNLLVGFKYIAFVIEELENKGRYDSFQGRAEDFLIGAEESHGLLLTSHIRDKDAAGPSLLLSELASTLKKEGKTICDYLNDIYLQFGYYYTGLSEIRMIGAQGMENMQHIMKSLRSVPLTNIGGREILLSFDRLDEHGPWGPIKSDTDKSSRNVLVYQLEEARMILRPSGTEPKLKIYTEIKTPALGIEASIKALEEQKSSAMKEAIELDRSFTKEILRILGISIPDYALLVSNLVPLPHKVDFCQNFLKELPNKAHEMSNDVDALRTWIDNRLNSYGEDPRKLVQEAIAAYLESTDSHQLSPEIRHLVIQIFQ